MKKYLIIVLLVGVWSCEDTEEDNTPPSVTLTFPQNGSIVYESVNITCISSDNKAVAKVELWVNGVSSEISDNTEPYSFNWNTTLVDNGSYTITIRSYDTSENIADSEPIVLTVDNTQSNPQPVNITSLVFENGSFNITWNSSTDGDFNSYELEKSVESSMDDYKVIYSTNEVGSTNYVDTDIDPLIYQYYRVTVIDTFDYETQGEIYSSSLDPAPSSVNVESIEYDTEQMTISWSESPDGDFKHYNLLYSTSEYGNKTSVTTITNKSTISHSITEFNPNYENWYWVEVSDILGQTSIGTGMTHSLNNEPTPVNVTSVTYDLESMTISWEEYVPSLSRINQMNQNARSAVTNDFVSYELLQSVGGGTFSSVVVIPNQSTTSHSLTEYDPTQYNWFKVKVTDYWGLNSTGDGMTNAIDSPPTQIHFTSLYYDYDSESINMSWTKSSDDDFSSYQLLYSETYNGEQTSITTISDINNTSYTFTDFNSLANLWWLKVSDYWNLETTGNIRIYEIAPLAFSEDFTNPNTNWSLNQYFSLQEGVLIHNGVDDGLGHLALLGIVYISNNGSNMLATPFELSVDVKLISTGTNTLRSIGFTSSDNTRYYLSISGNSWKFVSWDNNNGWVDIINWTYNENINSEGRLKILCLESTIRFYVDDHLLGSSQFDINTFPPVGLVLYSQKDAVVEFDNMALWGLFLNGNSRQLFSDEGDRISIINGEEKDLNMPKNDHNPE